MLNIGVTGHRKIANIDKVNSLVKAELVKIINNYDSANSTIKIISPLAEGADRIVIKKAKEITNVLLEVILPFPIEEYIKDFTSADSIKDFNYLIDLANKVNVINAEDMEEIDDYLMDKELRNELYYLTGKYVVDNSEIMLAIWNEKASKGWGGTGDIVKYAMSVKKCIVIINPENFSIKFEGCNEYKI